MGSPIPITTFWEVPRNFERPIPSTIILLPSMENFQYESRILLHRARHQFDILRQLFIRVHKNSHVLHFDIYDFYSVIALNVPFSSTTTTTRVAGLHPYIAVTCDGTHYTNRTHQIFASCPGSEVKNCSHVMSFRTHLVPSCEFVPDFDKPSQVLSHCDIRSQDTGLLDM